MITYTPDPDTMVVATTTSNAALAGTNLPRLEAIIYNELASWMLHLHGISRASTFESITAAGNSPDTKRAALVHILETLPARHKALVSAHNTEGTELIHLSNRCTALVEQLHHAVPDLDGYYDRKLFREKGFRADVLCMEKEIAVLEHRRLVELKELMAMFEELRILWERGELETVLLELLVQAMDDVGISASSRVDGERRSGVDSDAGRKGA